MVESGLLERGIRASWLRTWCEFTALELRSEITLFSLSAGRAVFHNWQSHRLLTLRSHGHGNNPGVVFAGRSDSAR